MKTLPCMLAVAILAASAAFTPSPAVAQVGYYEAYRPYSYRSLSRTGKYHGYWRDQGYGFSARGARGYYLPRVNYYYGGYAPVYPPPAYYPPVPPPYPYR